MAILVLGGAGYIGSHTAVELIATGFDAVLVDDLSNSEVAAIEGVRAITGRDVPFVEADCCDREALERIFTRYEFGSAIHFAASKAVGESLREPMKYYRNNPLSFMNPVDLRPATARRNTVYPASCTFYRHPRPPPAGLTPCGLLLDSGILLFRYGNNSKAGARKLWYWDPS